MRVGRWVLLYVLAGLASHTFTYLVLNEGGVECNQLFYLLGENHVAFTAVTTVTGVATILLVSAAGLVNTARGVAVSRVLNALWDLSVFLRLNALPTTYAQAMVMGTVFAFGVLDAVKKAQLRRKK